MNLSKDKGKLNKLPKNPGVYMFLDEKGRILYIGKATSLRDRVKQYFSGRDERGERIFAMVEKAVDIKVLETESVLEALILEANLIKKHQPKYNIEKKDDKSFSHVVLTNDEFPRFIILRQTELDKISNFQFPTLPTGRQVSNQIPISNSKISNKKLQAKSYKLKAKFGPYTSKKQLEIALNIIRKIFPFHSLKQKTEKGCLDFQIGKCPGPYAGAISKVDYAKNIRGIKMILEGKKQSLVKRMEKEMESLARKEEFEKAGEVRNKIFALKHIQDIALISMNNEQETVNNMRIEAYDISNISGTSAVGSMVVFNNSEPDKSQYRKFKIKTVEGANDVGMMAEVLFRRFDNDWPKPDLILLDGGKGHLNMAEKVLQELNLKIPMVAVAKGPTRKISNFQFLVSNQFPISKLSNEIKNVLNDKMLVGRIVEESHRFAITYHRKVRKKNFLEK